MILSRGCCTALMAMLLFVPSPVGAQGQSQSQSQAQSTSAQQSSPAQVPEVAVEQLGDAFSNGNEQALLAQAADRVEVSLFGTRTYYSRSQALYVMRDFFEKYAPRRFEAGEVAETGESYFVTGQYWHVRAETPLRVYLRVSVDGETWHLHEIRVQRQR